MDYGGLRSFCDLPLSAFCCRPFRPPLARVNQPKELVSSEVYSCKISHEHNCYTTARGSKCAGENCESERRKCGVSIHGTALCDLSMILVQQV